MKIAIPTYKRSETLRDKTLKMLIGYGFTIGEIYIFVANEEEKKIYEQVNPGYQYILAEKGVKNVRNFMVRYFKQGEKIVYFDDDIEEIQECFFDFNKIRGKMAKSKSEIIKKGKSLRKIENLKKFIEEAFRMIEYLRLGIWGVYLPANAFFMKETGERGWVTTNLRYIPAGFYGVVNDKMIDVATIDDKEDYERTIHFYLKYGGVLRFNNIAMQTKYYVEKGGMQEERTKERVLDSAIYLAKKYPFLCKLNLKKASGFAEIKFISI